jgi:hypothetical protein
MRATKKILKLLLFLFVIAVFVFFFWKNDPIHSTKEDETVLQSYDIIVTSGQSTKSKLLQLFNFSLNSYTHIGVVSKVNEQAFVLHATPDGTAENGIRFDDLQRFLTLSVVDHYVILRAKKIENQMVLDAVFRQYLQQQIPFDDDFDNTTKDKLYCSELIYDMFAQAKIITSEIDLNKPILPEVFIEFPEFTTVISKNAN